MATTDTTRRNSLLDASTLTHVPSTTRRPANISRTSSTSIRSLKYTLDYPARPSCSQLLAENATLKRELVQRHAQIRQLSTQNKTFRSMLDLHSAHIGSESSNNLLLSSVKLNFINTKEIDFLYECLATAHKEMNTLRNKIQALQLERDQYQIFYEHTFGDTDPCAACLTSSIVANAAEKRNVTFDGLPRSTPNRTSRSPSKPHQNTTIPNEILPVTNEVFPLTDLGHNNTCLDFPSDSSGGTVVGGLLKTCASGPIGATKSAPVPVDRSAHKYAALVQPHSSSPGRRPLRSPNPTRRRKLSAFFPEGKTKVHDKEWGWCSSTRICAGHVCHLDRKRKCVAPTSVLEPS